MKYKILIIFISLITFAEVSAQCITCPPPPGGIGFDDNVNDEIPINGLVLVGLVVGAFFGVKKIKK
ncbi:hypothetical protein [Flavobacterium sp. CS20]|jgi:hypothetical protein|uniref:hypothetical protein n=1 Tax=Flavobacterium sp. CS20 TaxID=2775246 RepID=UPI001B3A1BD4|nr:hypothetical protein [Flavobacterium sp. CS20]QTY25957.1 hypothetical protein IGB25_07995 [Flavobacterium sp. CS20]